MDLTAVVKLLRVFVNNGLFERYYTLALAFSGVFEIPKLGHIRAYEEEPQTGFAFSIALLARWAVKHGGHFIRDALKHVKLRRAG